MKLRFFSTVIILVFLVLCVGCNKEQNQNEVNNSNSIEETQGEQLPEEETNLELDNVQEEENANEGEETSDSQEESVVLEKYRIEPLLEISVGVEPGEIGYEDNPERMKGPEAFIVNGKDIYILDTINNRILIFEGTNLVRSVPVEESYRAQNFVVYKNSFFVLDMSDTICEYNPEGVVVNEYDLPNGKYYYDVEHMRVTDDRKVVINFADGTAYSLEKGEWILHNEEAVSVKLNEENVKIEYKELAWAITWNIVNEGIRCLRIDNENNCYVLRMTVGAGSVISFTYRIEKYSLDGKLVAWADIDTTDWIVFLGRCIHVTSEGEIYIMAYLEDKVVGMQVFLGNMD